MKKDLKTTTKAMQFDPQAAGKEDFYSKVKCKPAFSDPSYFKTVHISGEDMVREMAEQR